MQKEAANLTSYNHHANGEDLLIVRLSSDIPESHRCHARHREIQGRYVHGPSRRPANQLILDDVLVGDPAEVELLLGHVAQLPEPAVGHPVLRVTAADAVEDAGQPVGHQHVEAQQEYEHGSAILQVAIQLADDTAQAQQSDHLEGTEQAANPLLPEHNGHFREIKRSCFVAFDEKNAPA